MGNKGSKSDLDNQESKYAFSEDEIQSIKKNYTDISTIEQDDKTISKAALESKLAENPSFAAKLHYWMVVKCPGGVICPECFIAILEIFIKDPINYKLAIGLNKYERVELFALISLENYHFSQEEDPKIKISYLECLQITKDLLSLFKQNISVENNSGALAITNNIFEKKDNQLEFKNFISKLKDQMKYINKMIAFYFLTKFVDPAYSRSLTPPKFEPESLILSEQLWTLLWLNNEEFHKLEKLDRIYSMSSKGTSFARLSTAICGYNGPTLVLIKHKDKEADPKDNNEGISILGAYMSTVWSDQVDFQGDNSTFLFSLFPTYKQFHTINGQGGTFAYLNSREAPNSDNPPGFGFGGTGFGSFRIWIDADVDNKSYTQPNDITFEKGLLAPPEVTELNIQEMEVWGLAGKDALEKFGKLNEMKAAQNEDFKKPSKKDQVSDFDKEILFEKVFAGANKKEDR